MKSLSIIIPTFNDETKIEYKIQILLNKLKKIKIKYEIILINDGSIDATKHKIIKIIKRNKNIFLINNKINMGKSFSIRKGLKKTKYKYVILIDSDLPYFSKFNSVINLLKKNYDFIYINRRHSKSHMKIENISFYKILRFILSYFVSLILRYAINLNTTKIDTQAGFKAFKKIEEIENYNFISKKFFLDVELIFLYTFLKKKIISVPVSYKISGSSSIKFLDIKMNLNILYELLKVIINTISAKKKL
jgi:glycosyltransferase involved in cell wall biosynthesis